ncbi:DNA cytosine methyltransferase [Myxococcus eversor]|uniref:DNA cytosine methyltransferase n=1 Tax=Myxococcus eversor TaxID=2709661 RepID=UPI0013CFFF6F|nr:DNA cytosine methyltransferase [Myxococcus eversor]
MSCSQGIIVDLFAGGGGASTGVAAAVGRDPDVALNHDPPAIRVYKANHPNTLCLAEDIWKTPPREVVKLLRKHRARSGRPLKSWKVWALWASPDCTHFAKARGSKPRQKNIRSLAHVVVRWARDVSPEIIFLENVEEFVGWGPLYEVGHVMPDGRVLQEGDKLIDMPIPERKGEYFDMWRGQLELLGYRVEWRLLTASKYGAPTNRKRLFLVARRDGQPIVWPEPTHGPGLLPMHTAAECIDWSLPVRSIFGRKKPLVKKTLWRVAQGIRKYVFENPRPFIIKVNHGGLVDRSESIDAPLSTVTATRRGHALVAPTLIQAGYGERLGQEARTLNLHAPLGTVVAQGRKHALVQTFLQEHHLVAPFIAKGYGGHVTPGIRADGPLDTITTQDHHALAAVTLATFRGTAANQPGAASVEEPLGTITAGGIHVAEVRAFLTAYYGSGSEGQRLDDPMRTITAVRRMGLVLVEGVEHQIVDIGLRMLEPHELLRAQFGKYAEGYDLSAVPSKAGKVRLIGNSVCPEAAEAVVRANLGDAFAGRRAA